MDHRFYKPQPPLDALVEFFWATETYESRTARERVLPTGSLSLVVNLGEAPVSLSSVDAHEPTTVGGAVVCGARTSPLVLDTSALGPTVGIQFRPGGTRPFLDIQAEEVADRAVPLDAIWGAAASDIREQLLHEPSLLGRAQLLERCLLQRARGPLEHKPALRASLAAFEDSELKSVADVNQRTGLSPKRLLALFRDEVGLSPKAYWRVRRFRAALHDLESGARGASLAVQHGYCDQAHFLREFRALSGSCPSEYLKARVPGTDHVAVAD